MVETQTIVMQAAGRYWVIRYYAEQLWHSAATWFEPEDMEYEFLEFNEADLVDEGVGLWMPNLESAVEKLCRADYKKTYGPYAG